MKIAITSTGEKLSDSVAELFGRCPYFIIAEISAKGGSLPAGRHGASGGENGKIVKTEALKNENEDQASGAGMSAAKLLAENDVNAVIAKFGTDRYPMAGELLKKLHDLQPLYSEQ